MNPLSVFPPVSLPADGSGPAAEFHPDANTDVVEADWSALHRAHSRTVDARAGFETMLGKAEPGFRPTVQRFFDLHDRHAVTLARLLSEAGEQPDSGETLMGSVNRAVVSLRALFDDVDADTLDNISSGEAHVLEAYDAVGTAALPPAMQDSVAGLAQELRGLLTDVLAARPTRP